MWEMELRLIQPDIALDGELRIRIEESTVSALLNFEGEQHLETARNYVRSAVQCFLDTMGFLNGVALDVDFERVEDSNGQVLAKFELAIPALATRETRLTQDDLQGLFTTEEYDSLRRCLADLRHAIREPHDTSFFLYRAIESLMQHFRTDEKMANEAAWEALRAALDVPKEITWELFEASKPGRHGAPAAFHSDSQRAQVLKDAWFITEQFIRYMRRRQVPVEGAKRIPTMF